MYQSPLISTFLHKKLLTIISFFHNSFKYSILTFLQNFYLNLNIWYFYKNFLFNNQGILISNFTKSVQYNSLSNNILNLKTFKILKWERLKTKQTHYYIKEIKILPFSIQKVTFNKLTFLIIFLLLQPLYTFNKYINISYSFLFLTKNSYLFPFFSAFYFKVYNY